MLHCTPDPLDVHRRLHLLLYDLPITRKGKSVLRCHDNLEWRTQGYSKIRYWLGLYRDRHQQWQLSSWLFTVTIAKAWRSSIKSRSQVGAVSSWNDTSVQEVPSLFLQKSKIATHFSEIRLSFPGHAWGNVMKEFLQRRYEDSSIGRMCGCNSAVKQTRTWLDLLLKLVEWASC